MPAPTGANTTCWYRRENEGFKQEPSESDNDAKPWGADATLDTAEGSNEAVRVLEPASKEAAEIIKLLFSGSFTVTFTLTNPWWLQTVLGEPESDGTDPTTHTFDGDVVPTRIYQGNIAGGYSRVLYGCVVAEATIDATVPNRIEVSLSGAYAGEQPDDSTPAEQPSLDFGAVRFSEATANLGGDDLSIVQNASVTIATNVEMVNALGTDEAVDYYQPTIEPEVSYGKVRDDTTDTLEDFYGSSDGTADTDPDPGEFVLDLDSARETNELTLTVESSLANSYGTSAAENPDELTTEDINRLATGVTAEAVNDVEAAP